MVRKPKTLIEKSVFMAAAVFGAHINNLTRGFNCDSVKFIIDVLLNWTSPSTHKQSPLCEETNIIGYLDELASNSFAKKLTRKAPYRYTLSEPGLVELTARVVNHTYLYSPIEFFFVFTYIESYSPRILAMMKNKGQYFPYQTRLEIESLLDVRYFLKKQFDICEREISALKERLELATELNVLITPNQKQNKTDIEIISIVEENYPFALHSIDV